MKAILVVFALVASSSAQWMPYPFGWYPIAAPVSTQYHAQDELGQFAFGHRTIDQARDEVKTFDGKVRGVYSYVDPTGKLVKVDYLADSNGFRILDANNIPVAPVDKLEPVKETEEVKRAREEFTKKFEEEKAKTVGIMKMRTRRDVSVEEKKEVVKPVESLWSSPLVSYPWSIVSPYSVPLVNPLTWGVHNDVISKIDSKVVTPLTWGVHDGLVSKIDGKVVTPLTWGVHDDLISKLDNKLVTILPYSTILRK